MSARIAEIARSWIGTPYIHQASCRNAGADCLGLIRGVWRELYGCEPAKIPAYTCDWDEPRRGETLLCAVSEIMISLPAVALEPGDLLLFRMRDRAMAKHMGIVASGGACPTFVHAYSGHGVVETTLNQPWQRRVVARFGFPKGS